MITFAPLRTRRLSLQLKELTIGDEMALCTLPEEAHEKALTEFLKRAIEEASTPTKYHVADPLALSVGERVLALAHYCTHTREDAPDYAVTDVSKLSDYLDYSCDLPAKPATFSALDDTWVVQPLSGAALEAIETLQPESALAGSAHWIIGGMAAQLLRAGEEQPDAINQFANYVEWLSKRMSVFHGFPSSDFDVIYAAYRGAVETDAQFFRYWFDESGVVILPLKEAGAALPPARFLVHAGIGALALFLAGK